MLEKVGVAVEEDVRLLSGEWIVDAAISFRTARRLTQGEVSVPATGPADVARAGPNGVRHKVLRRRTDPVPGFPR